MSILFPSETNEARSALRAKLAALRRRFWVVRAGTGLALAVVCGIELLGLVMFLDWWVELPWGVRLLLLLVQGALLGSLLMWFVLLPWWRRLDDEEVALMVERARPVFGQRLIAAVQLSRPGGLEAGASAALAEATVEQAGQMAAPMDFREIVPLRQVRRLGWLASGVAMAGLISLWVGGATSVDLLRRAFLSNVPVPRKTRVLVENADRVVGRGDAVRLEALASGVIPNGGTVELRMPERRPQRFAMEALPQNRKRFARVLENVQDSFQYVVLLNDGRSGPHTVEVRPRPAVRAIEAVQEYPPYTGLGTVPRSMTDLTLLAGSRLRLAVEATQPIQSGQVRLVGTNHTAALDVDARAPAHLTGSFVVPRENVTGFGLHLVDTQGMGSDAGVVYRMQVVPDRAPEVRLTYPERKEELVTRGAKLLVGIEAADDFAVANLGLRYRANPERELAAGTNLEPAVVELDLAQDRPRRVERRFLWDLSRIVPALGEGTWIEYWVEAGDNNDATGPGRGESEHRLARVVSETEKRADLLNRAGDIFSGIADATQDQEELNRRLGEIILEKTGP